MADDACEAAFAGADPTGASKYYRARYYSPRDARFASEDPIGFRAGVNFYRYVSNNPANRLDPLGLADCCPEEKCPSGIWYGAGVSGGGGYGVFGGPGAAVSLVRVTCWLKPTLTADVAIGCGGYGVNKPFKPPLQAYGGVTLDGVVCSASCKGDLLGNSTGGSVSFFFGLGGTITYTSGTSKCVAVGPGVGLGSRP
jgi:RHS repeat-associated protein